MHKQVYLGPYGKMDFPQYKFQEYPKYVTRPDGTTFIVNTPSEELKAATEIDRPKEHQVLLDENADLARKVAELQEKLAAAAMTKAAPKVEEVSLSTVKPK